MTRTRGVGGIVRNKLLDYRYLGFCALVLTCVGCGSSSNSAIQVSGSDTMVNVAQKWAEIYMQENPGTQIQVAGGGSGVGIAALIGGDIQLANASRTMKYEERELAEKNTGKVPLEFIVGRDALAIYVHKDNPLEEISLEQLAQIYGEGGNITKWSQLGNTVAGCATDEIVRVSRQSSSGTYVYFREAILGKERDYKQGSLDQSGSKDVVDLVAKTPCAIGYSGMGYATDQVKMLKISAGKDVSSIAPTVENAMNGTYPIARPLLIYTLGEPEGTTRDYLDWIMSAGGQKIVSDLGYVPLK